MSNINGLIALFEQSLCDTYFLSPSDLKDNDNVFSLGADSMFLMRVVSLFRQAGFKINLKQLYDNPTIGEIKTLLSTFNTQQNSTPKETKSYPIMTDGQSFLMTPVQHAYYVGRDPKQPLGGNGCHLYQEFESQGLEPDTLEKALNALLIRHPMLSVAFRNDGFQRWEPPITPLTVFRHDLTGQLPKDVEAILLDLRDTLSHRTLDVQNGQTIEFHYSLLPNNQCRVHVSIDLLVMDAASFSLFFNELSQLLRGHTLDPLPKHYDFCSYLAQESVEFSAQRHTSQQFWSEQIKKLPSEPKLPMAIDPMAISKPKFQRRQHSLSAEKWATFQSYASQHKVTPTMVLATAYAAALSRWSGQTSILLNLTLFDCHPFNDNVQRLLADFTNILLLDMKIDDKSVIDLVQAQQRRFAEVYEHRHYSGVEVIRELKKSGTHPNGAPVVFTSNLNRSLFGDDVDSPLGQPGWGISQTPQVWLDFVAFKHNDAIMLQWDSVDELFPSGLVDSLFSAFLECVDYLLAENADWTQPLPDLLPKAQKQQRLSRITAPTILPHGLLHDRIFDFAKCNPNKVMVVQNQDSHNYETITYQAKCLANTLLQAGLEPDERVAISMEKNPGQIIAVLAILYAGGVYVPIAPDQPLMRRQTIIDSAKIRFVLRCKNTSSKYNWTEAIHFDWQDANKDPLESPPYPRTPDDTAYIIYTSGSTGTPKGVVISHASALNTCIDINQRHQINFTDRVLALSSLHFDLSVYDIFGILSAGGTLILPLDNQRRDPMAWADLVEKHGVTIWNTVPALFDMFLTYCEGLELRAPSQIRTVMLSGDWIDLSLPDRYHDFHPQGTFSAMGGATEAAIWSNEFIVDKVDPLWSSIPYGYPLSNQAYRVVDSVGRDCPDWVSGELWIGGVGVAKGYWNDSKRTSAQFVTSQDPINGELLRWYRTGDMGCYWPNGTLEFLGRQDTQVKIGGYRIELGDIDAALNRIKGVRHGVSLALRKNGSKDPHLEVFVIPEGPHLSRVSIPEPNIPNNYQALFPNTEPKLERLKGEEVAYFLQHHLHISIPFKETPKTWDEWCLAYGLSKTYEPLFMQWWALLHEQGLAERIDTKYRLLPPKTPYPIWFDSESNFQSNSETLKSILQGEVPANALLDTEISPEAVLFNCSEFRSHLSNIAQAISTLSSQLGRPVNIAEFEARSGRAAQALLDLCNPNSLQYHAFDTSLSLVQSAKDRLSTFSNSNVHHWNGEDHPLFGHCDIVLINNVIHRVKEPEKTLTKAQKLLTAEGLMLVLEMTDFGENALISALVIKPILDSLPNQSELLSWFESSQLSLEHTLDQKPLMGYVLRNQAPVLIPNSNTLKEKLAEQLPHYMLPKHVNFLNALPLSPNGKVDRKQLSSKYSVQVDKTSQVECLLNTDQELLLAQVWQSLFPTQSIDSQSDFFLLGGDSLMATRCIGQLQKLGYTADLTDLFANAKLENFAKKITTTKINDNPIRLKSNQADRYKPFSMNEVQEAYWIGRQSGFSLGETSAQFFVEFGVTMFEPSRFNHAMNRLIVRHDGLRTIVRNHKQQVLVKVPNFSVQCHTFEELHGKEADSLRTQLSHRVNNPANWPLFTVEAIVSPKHDNARLCIGLDNMMLDGLSMQLFFSELEALYLEPTLELPILDITFRDVLEWQRKNRSLQAESQAKTYWLEQIKSLPAAPALPLQTAPSTITNSRFIRIADSLSIGEWQSLKKLASKHQVTPSSVLLTAYAATLASWGSQSSLTLNLTLFDRPDVHPQINQILGDFTTLLLLAWHKGTSWIDSLKRLQRQLVQDLKHSNISAVWVMREMAREQKLVNAQMPVVFTSALGTSDRDFLSDKGWLKPTWGISQTPQIWLDHQVYESEGKLCMNWDAVEKLLPMPVLKPMFEQYVALLRLLASQPQRWSESLDSLLPNQETPMSIYCLEQQPHSSHDQHQKGEPAHIQTIQTAFEQIVSVYIGENDNFFDAGASSLQLVQLHALLVKQGNTLSVTDLFSYPSPALLAGSYKNPMVQQPSTNALSQRKQKQTQRKLTRRQRVN
ncbi:non-ribosomal peptide synthetase [Vibrio hepatarius]|uniref:non-ribosomal peptide synthetase n=1 Tax=Vibrio hepatarius TaxID=171383 RepID=UPI001C08EA92|nr:non-ribosomal peptide synthetase [Vibrio hepatarius]MBU2898683.1 amino acid adenylation domain-containing protein [Vibrio hepatarius]